LRSSPPKGCRLSEEGREAAWTQMLAELSRIAALLSVQHVDEGCELLRTTVLKNSLTHAA